jgi:hypothetical protein
MMDAVQVFLAALFVLSATAVIVMVALDGIADIKRWRRSKRR